MKKIEVRFFIPILLISGLHSCKSDVVEEPKPSAISQKSESQSEKIQVLNMATFHFGHTTDAHKVDFDEKDNKNVQAVHKIAESISGFQPTVIVVEQIPEFVNNMRENYEYYLDNPDVVYQNPTEIQLLAFEVGRLSGVKRIYGIDHQMGYNYNIDEEIENTIDPATTATFNKNPTMNFPEVTLNEDTLSLLEKLIMNNQDQYLDFMITANAEILTHAGTEEGFEGADEASKFYQRNLRMYSNLNRIPLKNEDRVFILMGSAHTAFFREFLSRSPKYEMVNTFDYLK